MRFERLACHPSLLVVIPHSRLYLFGQVMRDPGLNFYITKKPPQRRILFIHLSEHWESHPEDGQPLAENPGFSNVYDASVCRVRKTLCEHLWDSIKIPNCLLDLREMTEILEKSNAFRQFDLTPQEFIL